jgi:hypothetical protein
VALRPATDLIRSAGSAQGECRASLSLGSAAESCLSVAETLGFFHSDNILKRSKVPTWTEQWSRSCVVKVSIRGVRQKNDQDLGDERDIFLSFGGRSFVERVKSNANGSGGTRDSASATADDSNRPS